jgi:hypothetical protein
MPSIPIEVWRASFMGGDVEVRNLIPRPDVVREALARSVREAKALRRLLKLAETAAEMELLDEVHSHDALKGGDKALADSVNILDAILPHGGVR